MNERRTARAVGILYILGTAAGMLSVAFSGSAFALPGTGPEPFVAIAAIGGRAQTAALMVLVMGFALVCVAVLLYPVLKKTSEPGALAYLLFRGALEAFTYLAIVLCWLALAGIGGEIARSSVPEASDLRAVGHALLQIADASRILMIFSFSLGAIILYLILYRSRLVPRWLSLWGLAAIALHLSGGFLDLFGLKFAAPGLRDAIDFPIFLQEMIMALWLIAKGFVRGAAAPTPESGEAS